MANAGYNATIKRAGTPVAFTNTHLDKVTGVIGKYQIRPATHRLLDPATPLVVSVGGTPVDIATTPYTIDLFDGTVQFAADQSGVVRGAGSYLPLAIIAKANNISLNGSEDLIEVTSFEDNGNKTRIGGLQDFSLTIDRYHTSMDANFSKELFLRQSVFIEIATAAPGYVFSGWFKVESSNNSGGVGDAESESITFQIDRDKLPYSFTP